MTPKNPEIHSDHHIRAFVDAHVHIHDCFDFQEFMDAAARNFAFHSSRAGSTMSHRYVLCLTESRGACKFEELAELADVNSANMNATEAVWRCRHSGNDRCLIAVHPILGEITIVAGRQIVTAEKLEILALGSTGKWDDGLPASDVVESVIRAGAIPVLPWGFGKWLGRRRHVAESLIEKYGDGSLYIGDNSGRPSILPDPSAFGAAKELGMRILPGSDPLPFNSEYDRAGSFGFYVDNVVSRECIWTGLCTLLQQGDGQLHRYGSLESPLRFVRNQVAMQFITRVANRWTAS